MVDETFVAAVAAVFGTLCWLQLPAVCGFMLSSTRAGPGNYVYSMWLGGFFALLGLAAAWRALVRRVRHPLLVSGSVACVAFLAFITAESQPYEQACRAVYFSLLPH